MKYLRVAGGSQEVSVMVAVTYSCRRDPVVQATAVGALVILLAITQLFRLIAEPVTRKIKGLPSSQLEIVTLAFASLHFGVA
jgi:hypothetical protein